MSIGGTGHAGIPETKSRESQITRINKSRHFSHMFNTILIHRPTIYCTEDSSHGKMLLHAGPHFRKTVRSSLPLPRFTCSPELLKSELAYLSSGTPSDQGKEKTTTLHCCAIDRCKGGSLQHFISESSGKDNSLETQ